MILLIDEEMVRSIHMHRCNQDIADHGHLLQSVLIRLIEATEGS